MGSYKSFLSIKASSEIQGIAKLFVSIKFSKGIFLISFSSKINGALIILLVINLSSIKSNGIIFVFILILGWNLGSKYINWSLTNSILKDLSWHDEVPNKNGSISSFSSCFS